MPTSKIVEITLTGYDWSEVINELEWQQDAWDEADALQMIRIEDNVISSLRGDMEEYWEVAEEITVGLLAEDAKVVRKIVESQP